MHEYLETRSDKSISYNNLRDLASIILKNNYFGSEELKVPSKRDFAIRIKLAPLYSNLVMVGLEKRIFQNSEFKPFLWLRYLDEIFGVSIQGFQKSNELFN